MQRIFRQGVVFYDRPKITFLVMADYPEQIILGNLLIFTSRALEAREVFEKVSALPNSGVDGTIVVSSAKTVRWIRIAPKRENLLGVADR